MYIYVQIHLDKSDTCALTWKCILKTLRKLRFVCNTLQHVATRCNTLPNTCNTLQHIATRVPWTAFSRIFRNSIFFWNTLQHTATHCNTLQHTATHCKICTLESILKTLPKFCFFCDSFDHFIKIVTNSSWLQVGLIYIQLQLPHLCMQFFCFFLVVVEVSPALIERLSRTLHTSKVG